MEEQWMVDRGQLCDLLLDQPHLHYRELAQIVGRSLSWVKKWAPRLRRYPNDDGVLRRWTSPRTYTRPSRTPLVVRKILDIRDHPPDGLRRVPGPKAILGIVKLLEGKAVYGIMAQCKPTQRTSSKAFVSRRTSFNMPSGCISLCPSVFAMLNCSWRSVVLW